MDLAVVQRLVCPMPHPQSPLVVRADAAEHGRMQRGLLGCPICNGEWNVVDGIARFGERANAQPEAAPDQTAIAAFLGLTEPKLVVIDGSAAAVIVALVREYGASVVALDSDVGAETASVIDGAPSVPLADSVANGVALLRPRDAAFVASAVRCLATEGRMLASTGINVPDGVREIARGAGLWVGEREAPVAIATLKRNKPAL